MTRRPPAASPSRRAQRLLLALILVLPMVASLALAPPDRAAAAGPPAQVTVTTLDPLVATPGSRLHVAGAVRNTSGAPLRDVEVRLNLSRTPVNSRAELAGVAAGRAPSRDGRTVVSQQVPRDLAAGRSVGYDLGVNVDQVATLTDFGVYVMTVEVLARHRDGDGRVAIVRTFLPWVPKNRNFKPAGFSFLWPLVSRPTRLADKTYGDDSLGQEMATDGRLTRLVIAGARLGQRMPLTWAVDPELLDSAQDMGGGYAVRARDGRRIQGTGAAAASRWLDQVRSATGAGSVLALPYADPDLVALRRGGLTADLVAARSKGEEVATTVLGRPTVTDVAWPADGFADPSTLGTLRGMGVQAAVLDARALPPVLPLTYTPGGRATIRTTDGAMDALLTDPVLTSTLGQTGQPLLTAQRFLAETAMITAELPSLGNERTILVAPPRRWAPTAPLLDRLVEASLQAPWMSPVSTDSLRTSQPPEIDRRPVRYPSAAQRAELPGGYLAALRDLHTRIATFGSILTDPDLVIPAFDEAAFRLESSWWRGRADRANRLGTERATLDQERDKVRVLAGTYTFGSRSGTIPLTIANGLNQEVVVDVRLTPKLPRLEIGQVHPVRIGPQRKVQVEVPAKAVANGVVFVEATLHTPNGSRYSEPVLLRVRVTQYGTVALLITLGAAGVLFLAAAVRLTRRGLAHRRRATAIHPMSRP